MSFYRSSEICIFKIGAPYTTLGWSGGAMVLGKLPVPGHPTDLD